MRVLESRILLALGRRDAAHEAAEAAVELDLEPALLTPRDREFLSEALGRNIP
jgi:hypothetical protein